MATLGVLEGRGGSWHCVSCIGLTSFPPIERMFCPCLFPNCGVRCNAQMWPGPHDDVPSKGNAQLPLQACIAILWLHRRDSETFQAFNALIMLGDESRGGHRRLTWKNNEARWKLFGQASGTGHVSTMPVMYLSKGGSAWLCGSSRQV